MERAADGRTRSSLPGGASAALRALLQTRGQPGPGRTLAIGWENVDMLENLAKEIVSAEDLSGPGGERFDTVLWSTGSLGPPLAVLAQVRGFLDDDGRLVAHARSGAERDADEAVRQLVRRLSEAGFLVLRDVDPGELGLSGGALVVARRDEFRIRSFQDGDEAAIAQLFVDSFHVERPAEHWRWKYHENPYGNRYISLAFSPAGEMASHYAGFPLPFWCGGRSFQALQMGDTMTGPRFRRVGRGVSSLLARTVRHFFAVYRRGPFEFFYGFNTGGIQRFCSWFIGGNQVEPVRFLERPASAPAPVSGYRVERILRVEPSWDRFFTRVASGYGFLVRRDAQYVDWRYLRCPDGAPYVVLAAYRWGRLVGWSVFRRHEERLVWGDALFAPRHARASAALLAAALEAPELAGAERVTGWFADRPPWWSRQLEALGFESRPEPNRLGFMILPDTDDELPLERIYYSMGDGDLF